jgi:hypothetical protein
VFALGTGGSIVSLGLTGCSDNVDASQLSPRIRRALAAARGATWRRALARYLTQPHPGSFVQLTEDKDVLRVDPEWGVV